MLANNAIEKKAGSDGADAKKIGFLIREEEHAELDLFVDKYSNIASQFIPVSIIGEGTFSTVYKAIDVEHYNKDNSSWLGSSRQDQHDLARLYALVVALDAAAQNSRTRRKVTGSALYLAIYQYIQKHYCDSTELLLGSSSVGRTPKANVSLARLDLEQVKRAFLERPPHFVAVKRINATSGPKRIADELSYLHELKGLHHVVPVITASRQEDQVIMVFPYFYSLDFRQLLFTLTLGDIAAYMRFLLEALAHVHAQQIMHRDIKPSNFLFARDEANQGGDRDWQGVLVDFGLAQLEEDAVNAANNLKKRTKSCNNATNTNGEGFSKLRELLNKQPKGLILNDPRQPMRASRAGTRGFRAPEVLFKVPQQTVAIDVWSVGVIMLTLLARRYPFFQSSDDMDALVELACVFGNRQMREAATKYERIWECNVPSVPEEPVPWRTLCTLLNGAWPEVVPDEAYDLLSRLLDLDYRTRITAADSLNHSFLINY